MPDTQQINKAALRLQEAAATYVPCAPVRDLIGDTDLEAAYAVQQINNNLRAELGTLIGRKIGLTSPAVQKQLGVDQPDYGAMFDDMLVFNRGSIAMADVMQPKVEAEIAMVLRSDLNGQNISMDEVRNAVEYATPCIEIAGSRIADWNIKITDTIADNASASHFVLGSQRMSLDDFDPAKVEMSMYKNGEQVSAGTGADCMGSPLISLHWLANTMVAAGTPLQAGQIVLTGALGPMANAQAGDEVWAAITGFEDISVNFT